jgi:hypothetical protein
MKAYCLFVTFILVLPQGIQCRILSMPVYSQIQCALIVVYCFQVAAALVYGIALRVNEIIY